MIEDPAAMGAPEDSLFDLVDDVTRDSRFDERTAAGRGRRRKDESHRASHRSPVGRGVPPGHSHSASVGDNEPVKQPGERRLDLALAHQPAEQSDHHDRSGRAPRVPQRERAPVGPA